MERADTQEASDAALDIFSAFDGKATVFQSLYDETNDKVVRIDMVHHYSQPTEAQYREFRNARRSKFLRKPSIWTVSENHNAFEKLYDAVVQSIDGAQVNHQPCTATTRSLWLADVPLWHKLAVVELIFGELVEKND